MTTARLALVCALVAACVDKGDPSETTADTTTGGAPTTDDATTDTTGEPTSSTTGTTTTDATSSTSTTDATTSTSTTDATATTGTATTDATSGSTGQGGGPSLAVDVQPIFDQYCVPYCHSPGGSASPYFHATAEESYAALVGKPSVAYPNLTYVVPGDREASYLWHKLNGTQLEAGGGGSKMPLGQQLSAEDIETIGAWIDQGAQP